MGYVFSPMFIRVKRLDFWENIKMSWRSVQMRWFSFFAFQLLIILFIVLFQIEGALLAIIGGSEGIQPIHPAEGFLGLPLLLAGFLVAVPWVYCARPPLFPIYMGLRPGNISGGPGKCRGLCR